MFIFLKRILLDGNKESFGRSMSLPFFVVALVTLIASSVRGLVVGQGIIEEAVTMAAIGFSLYTSSKYLSVKGKHVEIESDKDLV